MKKVLELEPLNKEARALAKEAQVGQKLEDQKSKGLFNKSLGGISWFLNGFRGGFTVFAWSFLS